MASLQEFVHRRAQEHIGCIPLNPQIVDGFAEPQGLAIVVYECPLALVHDGSSSAVPSMMPGSLRAA
jgi:hypothetical protein